MTRLASLFNVSALLHNISIGRIAEFSRPDFLAFRDSFGTASSISPTTSVGCEALRNVSTVPTLSDPWDPNPILWTPTLDAHYGLNNEQYFQAQADALKSCSPSNQTKEEEDSRNCILTMAENYECPKFSIFLRSLRETGSCARVVIFRSDRPLLPCLEVIESCGEVEVINDNVFPHLGMDVLRYTLALQYLSQTILCDNVFFLDFTDVLFQRNPFVSSPFSGEDLILTEEGNPTHATTRLTINNEVSGCNRNWVLACCLQLLKKDCMPLIGSMPVLNSGIIYGTSQAVVKLLSVFTYALERLNLEMATACDPYSVSGQGILNYIVYSGMLRGIVNVRVIPAPVSFFVHTVYYSPRLRDASLPYHLSSNPITNVLGQPYTVFHMYTREKNMKVVHKWLHEFVEKNRRHCSLLLQCYVGEKEMYRPVAAISNVSAAVYLNELDNHLSKRIIRTIQDFYYIDEGYQFHQLSRLSFISCLKSFRAELFRNLPTLEIYINSSRLPLSSTKVVPDFCSQPYAYRTHNSKTVSAVINGTKNDFNSATEFFANGFSFENVHIVDPWIIKLMEMQ